MHFKYVNKKKKHLHIHYVKESAAFTLAESFGLSTGHGCVLKPVTGVLESIPALHTHRIKRLSSIQGIIHKWDTDKSK